MDVANRSSARVGAGFRLPRTRRRWSVRPYVTAGAAIRTSPPAEPAPWQPPVSASVLARVAAGLRTLPATAPAPERPASRREASRELAAQLGPLAHRLRIVRPAAWAPAEANAPCPDVTTTAPLEVVGS